MLQVQAHPSQHGMAARTQPKPLGFFNGDLSALEAAVAATAAEGVTALALYVVPEELVSGVGIVTAAIADVTRVGGLVYDIEAVLSEGLHTPTLSTRTISCEGSQIPARH